LFGAEGRWGAGSTYDAVVEVIDDPRELDFHEFLIKMDRVAR
jgi:hypothetical protein